MLVCCYVATADEVCVQLQRAFVLALDAELTKEVYKFKVRKATNHRLCLSCHRKCYKHLRCACTAGVRPAHQDKSGSAYQQCYRLHREGIAISVANERF